MPSFLTPARILAIVTGLCLVAIAVLHLDIASGYTAFGDRPFSIGDQFYAQAVSGFVLTLVLIARPKWYVWAACAGFSALSLGALVYSRKNALPVIGLPGGFMETWSAKHAKASAYYEVAALVLSVLGLVMAKVPHGRAKTDSTV